MDGLLSWVLDQAKSAGPLVAVAAIAVNVILWRSLRSEQTKNRGSTEAMARSMTRAMIANAKALSKLSTKLERRNGR
jgi:hypothetical protein